MRSYSVKKTKKEVAERLRDASVTAEEAERRVKAAQPAAAAAVTAGVSPRAVIKQTLLLPAQLTVTPSACQKWCLQVLLERS